jgi:hypothetical protein
LVEKGAERARWSRGQEFRNEGATENQESYEGQSGGQAIHKAAREAVGKLIHSQRSKEVGGINAQTPAYQSGQTEILRAPTPERQHRRRMSEHERHGTYLAEKRAVFN